MIEIEITDEMRELARVRVDNIIEDKNKEGCKFGFNKNRIYIGYLGEEVIADYYNISIRDTYKYDMPFDDYLCSVNSPRDTYEYDMVVNGLKVEVKTISCKFRPFDDYLCSVNSSNSDGIRQQNADIYIFLRIKYEEDIAWILGYMNCHSFWKESTLVKKGETPYPGI